MVRFEDAMMSGSVLLADGAMGTNLFAMGLAAGEAPERWNLDQPDHIRALHQSFVDAGSDLFLTNSFGGNRYRLALHGLETDVGRVNRKAAEIARSVADAANRKVWVAGSVGPTGELIEPLGKISFGEARNAFSEQIGGLVDGGIDVIWIETISAPEELRAALEAAAAFDVPVCATMSFDMDGRTMMGLTPGTFVTLAQEHGLDGFGANCGVGVSDLMGSVLAMAAASKTVMADTQAWSGRADASPLLIAKANCGLPRFVDGKIVYDGTPEVMATFAVLARAAGARIIGGCCGTTAVHVAAMRQALDDEAESKNLAVLAVNKALGAMSRGAQGLAEGRADRPRAKRSSKTRRR